MRTVVKICGITNSSDAHGCTSAGADELGFNFFQGSPRYIQPRTAAEIIASLPVNVRKVGVFVNESAPEIERIAKTAALDVIQLHGDESPQYVSELRGAIPLSVIKAFRVQGEFPAGRFAEYEADAFLLDAHSSKGFGGSGEIFDWAIAQKAIRAGQRIYLAGGLNETNVRYAVESVRPCAVDACSGLESEKGRKDLRKVAEFVRRVREADEI